MSRATKHCYTNVVNVNFERVNVMSKKRAKVSLDIPKDESKQARFVRIVLPRIVKAVKAIGVVGYCTGSAYEYTSTQTDQIVSTLHEAVRNLEDKFEGKAGADGAFSFKSS